MQFIIRIFKKTLDALWLLFLQGLFTILPLTLTVVLFHVAFKLVTTWVAPVRALVPLTFLDAIPYAEVVIIILAIFALGIFLRLFVLHPIIHALESLIVQIPLVRPVYAGIKQLVQAFSMQDKMTFKHVVLIEFPRKGIYSLGFLTSELPQTISPGITEKYFNVFIPTTPNPTSGYFIMVPETEVKTVDLTRQEAMAMIISGGIIQPERFE
jgi:uncharacterized membrane protein